MEYRYEHFQGRLLWRERHFGAKAPAPGAMLPDFDLETVDGRRVRRDDFRGRPLLVTTGSITCPVTTDASPRLKALHNVFGGQVQFLTVYVREAHPGERREQPHDFPRKLAVARAFQERDALSWPVAVDDIEGDLHRRLGGKSSPAFLFDASGRLVFRAILSNDSRALRSALAAVTAAREPSVSERAIRLAGTLRAIGVIHKVLGAAGRAARRDLLHAAPPLYLLGALAHALRPLPPLARGIGAVALAMAALGLGCRALGRAARGRD